MYMHGIKLTVNEKHNYRHKTLKILRNATVSRTLQIVYCTQHGAATWRVVMSCDVQVAGSRQEATL